VGIRSDLGVAEGSSVALTADSVGTADAKSVSVLGRHSYVNRIVATYQIVTPMFLGEGPGSRGIETARAIRPPSIKGALRFWWRALCWKDALKASKGDVAGALRWLHGEEARTWGAAANDDAEERGQSPVLLTTRAEGLMRSSSLRPPPGQAYLLGQGLYDPGNKGIVLRTPLAAGAKVTLTLLLRPERASGLPPEALPRVLGAVKLLGLIGGLGARARRGWGSLALSSLEGPDGAFECPIDVASYRREVAELCGAPSVEAEPPYTAFWRGSRIDVSLPNGAGAEERDADVAPGPRAGDVSVARRDWSSVLNRAGSEMLRYRGYGRAGGGGAHMTTEGREAEQNFKDDHDLVRDVLNRRHVRSAPRRAVFGLPHNYFFSSDKAKAEVGPVLKAGTGGRSEDGGGTLDRRGSPLLLHIHQFPTGECIAVHALLWSRFLPAGAEIAINSTRVPAPTSNGRRELDAYLDRFANRLPVLP